MNVALENWAGNRWNAENDSEVTYILDLEQAEQVDEIDEYHIEMWESGMTDNREPSRVCKSES